MAFVRSPHAHARIIDIDASGALDVDGLVAVYTYDDLLAADEAEGSDGRRAAAAAHPAPGADAAAHRLPAGPRRGQPRRRGGRDGRRAPTATWPRTPPSGCVVTYDLLPPVVGVDNAAARRPHGARRRPRQRRRAHAAGGRRRRRRDGRRAAHAVASTSTSSAARRCRWRARACTPAGTPPTGRCASTPRPRPRRRCALRSPPSWPAARQGRVRRADGRRRVRREDRAPVAGGGAGAVGRPSGSATRSSGSRTAASTSSRRRTSAGSCRR